MNAKLEEARRIQLGSRPYSAHARCKATDSEAFLYDSRNGAPAVALFIGAAQKPKRFVFRNEAHRARYIADAFAQARAHKERADYQPDYKPGDLLRTCWGYDQTNVEWFEVIEAKGKHVVLREVAQERTATGSDWSGSCVPLRGSYIGEPIRRMASAHGIKIDNVRRAYRAETMKVAGVEVVQPARWSEGH